MNIVDKILFDPLTRTVKMFSRGGQLAAGETTVKIFRDRPSLTALSSQTGTSATNVCAAPASFALPPGRWAISGVAFIDWGGVPTLSNVSVGVSLTTGTLPALGNLLNPSTAGEIVTTAPIGGSSNGHTVILPEYEMLFPAGSAPLFFVVQATYTGGSSVSTYGWLRAKRI